MPKFNNSDVDVIVCWPKSMDFPLWRDFIMAHKQYFNRIFICFTETNAGIDYSDFVKSVLDSPQFCFLYPETPANEDWRNFAVNMALNESKSQWIWFTEEDMFVISPSFWPIVRLRMQNSDVLGYQDGATRLHPSNLWVKREFINKTSHDFGVVPDRLDHFARFFTQLRHTGAQFSYFKEDPPFSGTYKHFHHMNGLSHNLSLIQRSEQPVYKEEEFIDYLKLSIQIKPQDERYIKMCQDYLKEKQNAQANIS